MVKYIKGDILNVTERIIVQQVNCMGVWVIIVLILLILGY